MFNNANQRYNISPMKSKIKKVTIAARKLPNNYIFANLKSKIMKNK